jgi:hypothetical protein
MREPVYVSVSVSDYVYDDDYDDDYEWQQCPATCHQQPRAFNSSGVEGGSRAVSGGTAQRAQQSDFNFRRWVSSVGTPRVPTAA